MTNGPSQQDIDRSLKEFSESLVTQNDVHTTIDLAAPRGFQMTSSQPLICRNIPKDLSESPHRYEQIEHALYTIAKEYLDFSGSYNVVKAVKVTKFYDTHDGTNAMATIQLKRSLLLMATDFIDF